MRRKIITWYLFIGKGNGKKIWSSETQYGRDVDYVVIRDIKESPHTNFEQTK